MRVAVVGAGIGGLCAAVGLAGAGARVTVFERAARVRDGGSGLSVFANGMRALDALGIGDDVRALGGAEASALRGGQRSPNGRWLATFPEDALAELRVIDRGRLHDLLLASLGERVDVRADCRVIAATSTGELTIETRGQQESASFDLIVGADGLRSGIRSGFAGDPGVRHAGYATWRGITDGPVDLHGEAGETWGVGLRFGIAPLADGRTYWFAVHREDAGAALPDPRELQRMFGTWHAPIPQLIRATPASAIRHLPIEELAGRLPSYVDGRIVLLGDAAHAMTPDLGQGGGQAMEDAATLAALLHALAGATAPDPADVAAALARYDALRRPRTQRIAAQARMVGRVGQVGRPVLSWLRDAVLRATPASALRRRLNGVQSWQPPVDEE